MLTQQKIDRFYSDVEALKLKFPVAVISKATGDDKSNVSKYLKRKLDPPDEFIDRFNEKFNCGEKVVSRGTGKLNGANPVLENDVSIRLSDYIKEKEDRRKEMSDINKVLLEVLTSSLVKNTQYLETLIASGAARSQEIMKVFDKMAGQPEGTMLAKSGKIELDFVSNLRKTGSIRVGGNDGKAPE